MYFTISLTRLKINFALNSEIISNAVFAHSANVKVAYFAQIVRTQRADIKVTDWLSHAYRMKSNCESVFSRAKRSDHVPPSRSFRSSSARLRFEDLFKLCSTEIGSRSPPLAISQT